MKINWKLLFKYDRGLILIFYLLISLALGISWIFDMATWERKITLAIFFLCVIPIYFIADSIKLMEKDEVRKIT